MALKITSPAPKSQLWLLQGDCSQKWTNLLRRITEHSFNHSVEVLIPNISTTPTALSSLLDTQPPYYTAHLSLSHMIRHDVINKYILPGSLSALSIGARIDIDDAYAVLPTGKLVMSVDKDTYEQLGLQGRSSRYTKNQKFAVELDLTASHFKPGKPNYERAKQCLSERLNLEADFVMNCTGFDTTEAESQFLEDFKATRHNCVPHKQILHNFPMPIVLGDHPHGLNQDGELLSCSVEEFYTWLGVISNDGLPLFYESSTADSYVSTFLPPDPHSNCQYGIKTKWTAMVPSKFIINILEQLREYLCKDDARSDWVAVNVWGFEDTPVSWRTNEHGFCQSGDNHYTVVMFRTGQYWYLSQK